MISIAMATYNGGFYLQKQLDSIRTQTLSDIEIIICDDCSSDDTWNILQRNAALDLRIRCIRNEVNLGFKKNFEKAINLCTGEFVALSDQDDIWLPDHLEHLLSVVGDCDIACGDAELIDEESHSLHQRLSERDGMDFCPDNGFDIAYRIFFNSSCFQGASMLIRRDFLKKALPIPECVKYHDAWFSALSCFCGGLRYSSKVITFHRRHSSNASHALHWKKFLCIHFRKAPTLTDRYEWARVILKRCPDLDTQKKEFLCSVFRFYDRNSRKCKKILNEFFRIRHYRSVYTTRSKIYIER